MRITIFPDGGLQIRRPDGEMLFVNLGERDRGIQFLKQKVFKPDGSGQFMTNPAIKSFNVPKEFADSIRSSAIPEDGARKKDPNQLLPRRVDEKVAEDQFGLPGGWIRELQRQIIQGTGRQESPEDVGIERDRR